MRRPRLISAVLVIALLLALVCRTSADPLGRSDLRIRGKNVSSFEERLRKKIKLSHCIFYYTGEGRVGCKSPKSSSTGILYGVFNQSDIIFLATNPNLNSKYVIVMPYSLFTTENARILLRSNKLTGIVLTSQNGGYFPKPEEWSPMPQSPNWLYGLYRNSVVPSVAWNPKGLNDMSSVYDFNISMLNVVNEKSENTLNTIFNAIVYNVRRNYTGNKLRALSYKTDLVLPMGKSCIREREVVKDVCAPMGGQSVWATFSEDISHDDGKPVIMVIAKMDAVDLSFTLNSGSDSVKSSIAAVIGIANSVRELKEINYSEAPDAVKHIVFAFFYGESFGFSGSKTFVRDLIMDFECLKREEDYVNCPIRNANCTNPCIYSTHFKSINFSNIEYIIELDSIGNIYSEITGPSATVYIHSHQIDAHVERIQSKFVGTYSAIQSTSGTPFDVILEPVATRNTPNKGLPPSSIMSFLEKRDIPALLFTSYKDKFNNPYYYSVLDSKNHLSPQHLSYMCTLVDVISSALYKDISNIPEGKMKKPVPNCAFIEDVMSCITGNPSCSIGKAVLPEPDLLNDMDYDTGAFVYTVKFFPYIINRIMNLITRIRANALCLRDLDCKEGYICTSYRMISNKRRGTCVHGLSFYHNSYSPGMEYDPKKRVFRVANNALGTWTSPVKLDIISYLVTIPSITYQLLQLLFGVATTSIFSLALYLLQGRVKKRRM